MEPPISDDDFDSLWEEAVAEAARHKKSKPQRRKSMIPKEPSERRKPRSDSIPGMMSPQRKTGATRNTITLPLSLEAPPTSPRSERKLSLQRKSSRDTHTVERRLSQAKPQSQEPGSKAMRRHSSLGLDDITQDSPKRPNETRRSSTLTVSDDKLLQESMVSQISFSNLPELTELMKKPTIGTAATAASDFSSTKIISSKKLSSETDGGSGDGMAGNPKKSALPKKVHVDESLQKVADYILHTTENGLSCNAVTLPAIHSISSFKENKEQLSGLIISRDAGCEVLVRKITPNSIFAVTPLREGHEILTINDRRVKCPLRATTIIKSIKGEVNLLVSEGERPPGTKYVKAKIDKHARSGSDIDSLSAKSNENHCKDIGLTLEESRHGLVRVVQVEENSVFSNMSIREEDIILAVNGESAQSIDLVSKLLGKFNRRGGIAILLVYSMVDLRLGLVDRIIQSPWETLWDEDFKGVTISKKAAAGDEDKPASFCLVFDDDWSCDLISCDDASSREKEEIHLATDRLNDAISRAVKSWSDAIESCKEDQITAAC